MDTTNHHQAAVLMVQGTASNVGKSVIAAAFCRIFYQQGYKVSPFKAQNMALNSFVTADGGEMGRAQVVQAQAAGVEPDVRMNPVLLKPTGQASSQVIVLGKAKDTLSASDYHGKYQQSTWPIVETALRELRAANDVVVIEGAGSPAEVNLKHNDIVNMRVALAVQAPVLLVADIDRGGALAAVVGTLELLDADERKRVKGIILNKFRGDLALLEPALDFLEQKTGIPVVGVVPFYDRFRIPEEDSVELDGEVNQNNGSERLSDETKKLDIVVIRLPYISNFTDFDALRDEPDVEVRYVNQVNMLGAPDLVIIPGSKNTLADLKFLQANGMAARLRSLWEEGRPMIGICGGYQMMGRMVRDPLQMESELSELPGMGLLPIVTEFCPDKYTVQSHGMVLADSEFFPGCQGKEVAGYEIHMGHSLPDSGVQYLFELHGQDGVHYDGLKSGSAIGTYLHGIFDNDGLRSALMDWLWERRGLQRPVEARTSQAGLRETAFNELAEWVKRFVKMDKIEEMMGLNQNL